MVDQSPRWSIYGDLTVFPMGMHDNSLSVISSLIFVIFRFMDTGPDVLYIAGVADMQTLLQRPGDVATHDFIGCLRDVVLSGVDLQSQTPIASNGITNMCVRSEEGVCVVDGAAVCENEAMCVDEWDTYRCSCGDGYTGDTCDQGTV